MVEIARENINYGNSVDKYYKKREETGFIKSKTLMYLFGAFFIFAVANATLIYNFFRILEKLN